MSKEQRQNYSQVLRNKKQQVEELELNARYWKAQYELKKYTVDDYKITAEYIELVKKIQESSTPPPTTDTPVLEPQEQLQDAEV